MSQGQGSVEVKVICDNFITYKHALINLNISKYNNKNEEHLQRHASSNVSAKTLKTITGIFTSMKLKSVKNKSDLSSPHPMFQNSWTFFSTTPKHAARGSLRISTKKTRAEASKTPKNT